MLSLLVGECKPKQKSSSWQVFSSKSSSTPEEMMGTEEAQTLIETRLEIAAKCASFVDFHAIGPS